jgi:hypothetical protein
MYERKKERKQTIQQIRAVISAMHPIHEEQ